MTERPILFSAPMVRAILAGNKTQTRRVVKPQPRRVDGGVPFGDGPAWAHAEPGSAVMRCPFGQPGDRLWVRETFRGPLDDGSFGFRATHDGPFTWESYTWKPSIHMPRAASRITLAITGVRVERLQAISEADAIAEGVEEVRCSENDSRFRDYLTNFADSKDCTCGTAWASYKSLWRSINGADSWSANPWVWVVEFRKV